MSEKIVIDWSGTYGGPTSRDQLIRVLKEALALVEYTAADAELRCGGLRIELTAPGTTPSLDDAGG